MTLISIISFTALPCAVAWIDSDSSISGDGGGSSTQLQFGSLSLSSCSGVAVCQVSLPPIFTLFSCQSAPNRVSHAITTKAVHRASHVILSSNFVSQDPHLSHMKRVAAASVTGCGGGIFAAICACVDDEGCSSSSSSSCSALTIFDSRTLRIIAHAPLAPPLQTAAAVPPPKAAAAGVGLYHAREWSASTSCSCSSSSSSTTPSTSSSTSLYHCTEPRAHCLQGQSLLHVCHVLSVPSTYWQCCAGRWGWWRGKRGVAAGRGIKFFGMNVLLYANACMLECDGCQVTLGAPSHQL